LARAIAATAAKFINPAPCVATAPDLVLEGVAVTVNTDAEEVDVVLDCEEDDAVDDDAPPSVLADETPNTFDDVANAPPDPVNPPPTVGSA